MLSALLLLLCGCQNATQSAPNGAALMPKRDINAVLRDHDQELVARPGVVGVYVGLMADGKTPCLKVMLLRKNAKLQRAIPGSLEGYPVVIEVTGEIRPLDQ